MGDLADLRRFGRWSRRQGASIVLLNPLGAQTPTLPYQPSPYYSSSRRFRNSLYLGIDEIEGAEQCAAELEPLRVAALRKLNQERLIDYDQVFQLKTKALERSFKSRPSRLDSARGSADREARCVTSPPSTRWPRCMGQPGGTGQQSSATHAAVARSPPRGDHAARIAFHQWLQFHLDRQLARASKEIGLVTDVPSALPRTALTRGDGRTCWRLAFASEHHPTSSSATARTGACLPSTPWKLGEAHWEPFVAICTARPACVGRPARPRDGPVPPVLDPGWHDGRPGRIRPLSGPDAAGASREQSRRAGAFVVGEDLGLVPPTVRKHLRRRGSLSYRLLWFEGSEPEAWPRDAVAAIGTHDLPTVAGIWTRSEPEHRLHHLREKLVSMTGLPDETPPVDVAVAAYRALARGRPRIVLASLEDALG